ncbi:MAG: hypothetical protein KDC71_24125 [Acidobacteria bacterium]|nr:hypothetical protein [Acidobacteriota bacterium]
MLVLVLSLTLWSGDLTGTVTVLKKGGKKPLSDHSQALVYVVGPKQAPPPQPVESVQEDKAFVPRVLVVVKGQEVRFLNEDPIQHNVFSREPEQAFDLGHYPAGDYRSVVYENPGFYKVYCNIHQRMIQDIAVLENTYFALTDKAGNFSISNVPEGTYQLKVWHIYGGETEQSVQVGAKNVPLKLEVVSTVVVRDLEAHMDKNGKPYQSDSGY